MQEFMEGLMEDLSAAIRLEKMEKFTDFLKSLDDTRIPRYLHIAALYENKEDTDSALLLQKATLLYCFIVQFVEDKGNDLVKLDADGDWLSRLMYYLGVEKMRRLGHVEHFEGFLMKGLVEQKFTPEFVNYVKSMFDNMSVEEREELNAKFGRD